MSQVVNLSAQETADRLLPVLRDYATKLSSYNARASDVLDRLGGWLSGRPGGGHVTETWGIEAARLICLRDAIEKSVAAIAQNASGLLEHAELEHVVWNELKLRLDEVEEHLRFSNVSADLLKSRLERLPNLDAIRKLAAQGRYKAPF